MPLYLIKGTYIVMDYPQVNIRYIHPQLHPINNISVRLIKIYLNMRIVGLIINIT